MECKQNEPVQAFFISSDRFGTASSDMLVFKNDQFSLLHSLNRVQLPHFTRNDLFMTVSFRVS